MFNIHIVISGQVEAVSAEQTASIVSALQAINGTVKVDTKPVAEEAPAPAAEPQYLTLGPNDVIREGDEWILKSQYRTKKLPRQWRVVDKSVGDRVSAHSKSDFRRKIG